MWEHTTNKDATYQNSPFSAECFHCKAIHLHSKCMSNQRNCNSFGDCCLHRRIYLEFSNYQIDWCHFFQNVIHLLKNSKKKKKTFYFALALFKDVHDDQTIKCHVIYSIIASRQVAYKQLAGINNISFDPKQ